MKKRVVTFIVGCIISAFSYMVVSATNVVVEGENYFSSNFTPIIKTNAPEFSNSKMMLLYQNYQASKVYEISYKVNVATTGGYKLFVTSTLLNSTYTCNYYVQVNSDAIIDVGNSFTKIKSITSTSYPNTVAQYDIGFVQLAAGENTVKFIVKDDIRSDNYVAFYLDCFEFQITPFCLVGVNPNGPVGVFEKNQDIIHNVKFNFYSSEQMSYSYRVKDFWSKNIKGSNFTIPANNLSYPLNIGKLETGWYTLEILSGKSVVYSTTFSVVPVVADRIVQETPFAMDFASDWLVTTGDTDIRNYSKAAKMAGVQWVRERYRWSSVEPLSGSYSFDTISRTANIISSEGLKILNVFHDTPSWAKASGYLPTNLFDIYNMQKQVATQFKGKIQAWELWNEEDTAFASETADEYVAFLKAGAIGIADADSTIMKSFGGFANSSATTEYMDLCMQNEIMKYSDIYNCHVYGKVPEDGVPYYRESELQDQIDTENAYDGGKHPIWVSEGGAPITSSTEQQQRINQAKANVIVNIKSLARGTSKHFWFILSKYTEGSNEFGIFYDTGTPAPAYSAYATMTKALGKAQYKGKMTELPVGVEGYLFNNGEKDVAVFWSQTPTYVQFKAEQGVKLTNIMGIEKELAPCNGYINIPVTSEPLFITFNDGCQSIDYYQNARNQETFAVNTFEAQDRIIISQKFTGYNYSAPKIDGYSIFNEKENKCVVKVYNFNHTSQTGTINASTETGFILSKTSENVTIPAMGSVEIEFYITLSPNVDYDVTKFLKFSGEFGGKSISNSVSRIVAKTVDPVIPDAVFSNSSIAANWNCSGISSGSATASTGVNSGEVKFKVDFTSGNGWFYPTFYVQPSVASILPQKSGLCVWIYAQADVSQVQSLIFCYMSDGRKYFPGDTNRVSLRAGWNQIVWSWDDFVLQYSPLGIANETRSFDPALINYISIGINSATLTNIPVYIVKEFGYYTSTQLPEVKKEITIAGLVDNEIYDGNKIHTVTATLPADVEFLDEDIEVKLCNSSYNKYSITDSSVLIDLNGLAKGEYSLFVTAKNNMGYIYRKSINFYID